MSKKDHDNRAAKHSRSVNYQKSWFNHGLDILEKTNLRNFTMMDMGCGNGEFSEMARERFGADVTCLDYAEAHMERVKGLGFKTIKCDFDSREDVEMVNNTCKGRFDVIVSFEVIEHIFDVETFLSTAHNLLKANGTLIISTTNIAYTGYRIYSMFRGNLPVSEGHHIRFFNQRRLRQVLILNGFDIVDDCSFGRGSYYLDRAVGEKVFSMRALLINVLSRVWSLFTPRSSPSYFSSILLKAKKADVTPVGLDPRHREVIYEKIPLEEKKKVIERLLPLREKYFFDESPGLRRFIDDESETLKGQDHVGKA